MGMRDRGHKYSHIIVNLKAGKVKSMYARQECKTRRQSKNARQKCKERNHKQAFNHIALRKAKIAYNFGFSECKRVKNTTTALDIVTIRGKFF